MDLKLVRIRLVVCLCLVTGGALLGLFTYSLGTRFSTDTAFAQENLIRLHVLANSNLPQDQDLKLLVRDAILKESGIILKGIENKEQAQDLLFRNRNRIREIAESVVYAQGYDYPVTVAMGNFPFPRRDYGLLTLPEGQYQAVRVEIGQGKGENWWCVLFPPLCLGELESCQFPESLLQINQEKDARGIAFRFKFWDQIAWANYAQTIQRWWRVSAANYPFLAY